MELTILVLVVTGGAFCLASLVANSFEHPLERVAQQEAPADSLDTE